MSKRAETLVWERARAGKTDLLALVKISDVADDDGRNAWPEVPALARWLRATPRGVLYILHRLRRNGEIVIEMNRGGRYIELAGGRRFSPKWFLHVRCVYDWEAYQLEKGEESAKIADSDGQFPLGRPSRQSAKFATSAGSRNAKSFPKNANPSSAKCEKPGNAYKERSVSDPLVEVQAGAAPRSPLERADIPIDNIGVITRLAHDVLDELGPEGPDLAGRLKELLGKHKIRPYDGRVVGIALESAIWQRQHRIREG